jgi:hypothetical protein
MKSFMCLMFLLSLQLSSLGYKMRGGCGAREMMDVVYQADAWSKISMICSCFAFIFIVVDHFYFQLYFQLYVVLKSTLVINGILLLVGTIYEKEKMEEHIVVPYCLAIFFSMIAFGFKK